MLNKIKALFEAIIQHNSNAVAALRLRFSIIPAATVIMLIISVIGATIPFVSSRVLAEVINKFTEAVTLLKPIEEILWLVFLYVGVDLLGNIISRARGFISWTSQYKFKTHYEFNALEHRLKNIDIAREEDPAYKDLYQRVSTHTWALPNMAARLIDTSIPVFTRLIVSLVILAQYNKFVCLIAIVGALPQLLSKFYADNEEYWIWNRDGGREQRLYYTLRGYILGKTHRSEQQMFGSGIGLLSRIKSMYDRFDGLVYKARRRRIMYDLTLDVISLIAFATAMLLMVQDVFSGLFQVGILVFLFQTYDRFVNAVDDVLLTSARIIEESRYATDLRKWYDIRPVIQTPCPAIDLPPRNSILVNFKNVSFHYPKDQTMVLNNISLQVRQGEKIGIVGKNGSGKSTFVKLFARVYDPSEGVIEVNNIPLNTIPQARWFTYLAALFQNYSTYDYTIREAISISMPNHTSEEDEVKIAGEKSTADEFIQKLEKQYDHQIGAEFEGIEPSGGQRQKLALARTFFRKAPIMILDEPTAAIDTESELKIFKTLDELPDDQTVLFISHDFSTIRRADRILVFDEGRIIEDGTHEDLLAKGGKYSALYNKQKEAYE